MIGILFQNLWGHTLDFALLIPANSTLKRLFPSMNNDVVQKRLTSGKLFSTD